MAGLQIDGPPADLPPCGQGQTASLFADLLSGFGGSAGEVAAGVAVVGVGLSVDVSVGVGVGEAVVDGVRVV
jgi:hypothetical protein